MVLLITNIFFIFDASCNQSKYGVSNITNNNVRALAFDKNGVLWIATAEGINLFDGKLWKVYNPLNCDLPDPLISSLCFDKKGIGWISLQDGRVYCFKGGKFEPYSLISEVRYLMCDRSGRIWTVRDNGLVSLFNGIMWKHFEEGKDGFPYDGVDSSHPLVEDKKGNVWATPNFEEGLLKFEKGNWYS